jgi:hypothetical protein
MLLNESWAWIVLNLALMSSPEQLAAIMDERLSAGFLIDRSPEDEIFEGIAVLTTWAALAVPVSSLYATHPPQRLAELRARYVRKQTSESDRFF